ncbi:hypothetical protein L2E82_13958 [Cichorium intybus]|uniref:Uncharacterized protein n=1 Tax=Cichorium intybus TaxID=13427 RepID=A0ACB9EZ48_CICIN|nr:hypothetical protein L2E82_13958 [Cichorium intybus]
MTVRGIIPESVVYVGSTFDTNFNRNHVLLHAICQTPFHDTTTSHPRAQRGKNGNSNAAKMEVETTTNGEAEAWED